MKAGFFALILIGIYAFSPHKFYSSQTDLTYNAESESLEITVHLFTDDFELVLEEKKGVKLFLGAEKEHPEVDNLIYTYFKKHFKLSQSNKELHYDFIGKKVELDNVMNVYLELKNFKSEGPLLVENTVLFERFEKQVNTINYQYEDLLQSASLNKDQPKTTFKSPH